MTIGHTLALSRVCAAVGSRRLGDQLIMRSVCRARGALLLNSHKHGNQPKLRGPHALQPAATRSFETTQEMPATRHFGHPTQHSKYSQRNSFTVHPSIRSQFGELGPFFSHPLFRACLHRIRAHHARRTTVFDAREKEKKKNRACPTGRIVQLLLFARRMDPSALRPRLLSVPFFFSSLSPLIGKKAVVQSPKAPLVRTRPIRTDDSLGGANEPLHPFLPASASLSVGDSGRATTVRANNGAVSSFRA